VNRANKELVNSAEWVQASMVTCELLNLTRDGEVVLSHHGEWYKAEQKSWVYCGGPWIPGCEPPGIASASQIEKLRKSFISIPCLGLPGTDPAFSKLRWKTLGMVFEKWIPVLVECSEALQWFKGGPNYFYFAYSGDGTAQHSEKGYKFNLFHLSIQF